MRNPQANNAEAAPPGTGQPHHPRRHQLRRLTPHAEGPNLSLRAKDSSLSVNLTPTGWIENRGPRAQLVATVQDRRFKLTYEMPDESMHQLRNTLADIQRVHDEQTAATTAAAPELATKSSSTELQEGVVELLTWHAFLEVASTLRDTADFDDRQYKEQDLLFDKVTDMHRHWLTTIRDRVLTQRDGAQFVRSLLNSQLEILVNLGLRLAGDLALLSALHAELVDVYQDDELPEETRRRAYASMPPTTREAVTNTENAADS